MLYQPNSQSSLESISIKLTESNLPSLTLIKTSQQHISLTYTVSIDNISDQRIEIPDLKQSNDLMISIETKKDHSCKGSRYRKLSLKDDNSQLFDDKNVFRKNSILKISNLDFSIVLDNDKGHQSPAQSRPKKTIIKANNSGLFCKAQSPKIQNSSMIQSRVHSKSREIFKTDATQIFGEHVFLRTTRFYSLKNDKVMQPTTSTKPSSIRKEIQRRCFNSQTDRKYNKLPIIRGTNFHTSAPAAMSQKRKVLSCHQNAQFFEKNLSNLTEKMVMGKSCKMAENDQKARKYLQKIIQNRNSVMHYSEHRANKILREFKENIEE